MRKLILIKHASPQVQAGLPPEQWPLSDEGRAKCTLLTKHLAEFSPTAVVSSEEVKALETGKIVAGLLGVPFDTAPDLHEHDRSNVPQMRTPEFISMMELLFRRPNDLVLGKETAVAAVSRFRSALDEVLLGHPDGNVAVVSHGTVIALLLGKLDPSRKAYDVWRAMKLPSFAVLSLPGMAVHRIVASIDTPPAGPQP